MNCKIALTQGLPDWCSGKFISAVSVADVWPVSLPYLLFFGWCTKIYPSSSSDSMRGTMVPMVVDF